MTTASIALLTSSFSYRLYKCAFTMLSFNPASSQFLRLFFPAARYSNMRICCFDGFTCISSRPLVSPGLVAAFSFVKSKSLRTNTAISGLSESLDKRRFEAEGYLPLAAATLCSQSRSIICFLRMRNCGSASMPWPRSQSISTGKTASMRPGLRLMT